MKNLSLLVAAALLLPSTALGTISFTQIDDDVFTVSHRVKVIGSRGKATKMVYTKAASLCEAAGFSFYRVMKQESEASQKDDAANASLRVRFYFDDADDRLSCHRSADPQYVQEARAKLQKRGYVAPEAPPQTLEPSPQGADSEAPPGTGICSIEQIAAMARAGVSDAQIRAACLKSD